MYCRLFANARRSASCLGSVHRLHLHAASLWCSRHRCWFGHLTLVTPPWARPTTWTWLPPRSWLTTWPWFSPWFQFWNSLSCLLKDKAGFTTWFQLVTRFPRSVKAAEALWRAPTTSGKSIGGCLRTLFFHLLCVLGELVEGSRGSPWGAARHLLLQLHDLHGGVILQLGPFGWRRQVKGWVNRWGFHWGNNGRSLQWRVWPWGRDVNAKRQSWRNMGHRPDRWSRVCVVLARCDVNHQGCLLLNSHACKWML